LFVNASAVFCRSFGVSLYIPLGYLLDPRAPMMAADDATSKPLTRARTWPQHHKLRGVRWCDCDLSSQV
jgi:hypothetical protein